MVAPQWDYLYRKNMTDYYNNLNYYGIHSYGTFKNVSFPRKLEISLM